MKTVICIISLLFSICMGNAQKTSNPKVSISYSNDEPGDKNYKVNISITNNDDLYTLNASFPTSKTEKLKKYLKEQLQTKMTKNGSGYTWVYTVKGSVGHTVKLKNGKLDVYIDKKRISADLVEDFIDIFSDLKDIVKE
ncbi:hypothetical protein [Aquimarina sp. 2304DJ70-9]|uniref:hypothetical protein n=1 Tax=Aquimarina penaris TaxID=3231044 RepID=UPI0034627050